MKSFKVKMPKCPKCGSENTKIDIQDYSNLIRIPAVTATAGLIGVSLTSIIFICQKCKNQFKNTGNE